jgi:hypothetical protein
MKYFLLARVFLLGTGLLVSTVSYALEIGAHSYAITRIEYSHDVTDTNQWRLLTNLAPGTTGPISVTDSSKDDRRFYRAKTE